MPVSLSLAPLIIAVALAAVTKSRRISLLGLGLQYAATGLLVAQTVGVQVGLSQVALGVTATGVIWLSISDVALPRRSRSPSTDVADNAPHADAVDWKNGTLLQGDPSVVHASSLRDASGSTGHELQTSPFFRLMVFALCLVGAFGLAENYPLIAVGVGSSSFSFAWYLLAIAGAFVAAMTQDPLPRGVGLLLLLNGAQFAYTVWTAGAHPNLLAILAVSQVVLALLIGHLARTWLVVPENGTEPSSGDTE